FLSVRFRTTNQNSNQIHKANNNLNLKNNSILLSFFLDTSTSSVQVKKHHEVAAKLIKSRL
ncbi:MAG: hypothetical protein EBR24_08015, partial [Flavobacteriia bacterium]|nr:hypothetical protein [Flavobacteriia bacterium]